jgi:hypothetical protein
MVLGHHALHGDIERFEGFMANILSGSYSIHALAAVDELFHA